MVAEPSATIILTAYWFLGSLHIEGDGLTFHALLRMRMISNIVALPLEDKGTDDKTALARACGLRCVNLEPLGILAGNYGLV